MFKTFLCKYLVCKKKSGIKKVSKIKAVYRSEGEYHLCLRITSVFLIKSVHCKFMFEMWFS